MVGIYALGSKFGMLLNTLIGQPFTMIWVAFRFEIAGREDAKEIYARILTYFEFVLIFLTLWLILLIKDIIGIVAGKEFIEAYKVVPLIAISCLFLEQIMSFELVSIWRKKPNGFLLQYGYLLFLR